MLISILILLSGLGLLMGGGELLIRGAVSIALKAKMTPAVIGMTVVAAGTSMPELVVSVTAAVQGTPDLAMGNIVGSNIYNIALILGVTALIKPMSIERNTLKIEWPFLFLCTCLIHFIALDLLVSQFDGLFLVTLLVAFMSWTVYRSRKNPASHTNDEIGEADATSTAVAILQTIVGATLLTLGAKAMVSGAVDIATMMGVSERIVGLTIVALGTSLPELMASVVAAMKGRTDMAVGNVIGSNLFNTLGILGTAAAIQPISVNPSVLNVDNPWMIGLTLAMLPLMRWGMSLNKFDGIIFLSLLAGYSHMLYQS